MKKQHMWVSVVLLFAVVWGVFSWRWYTCGIKGFCNDSREAPSQEIPETHTPETSPVPEMPDLDDPKYWQKG